MLLQGYFHYIFGNYFIIQIIVYYCLRRKRKNKEVKLDFHRSLDSSPTHSAPFTTLVTEDTFLTSSFRSLNLNRTKFSLPPNHESRKSPKSRISPNSLDPNAGRDDHQKSPKKKKTRVERKTR